MADTVTVLGEAVMGNNRSRHLDVTKTDGAGTNITSGLQKVLGIAVTPKTCNTNGGGATMNLTADGDFALTSCTSGDTFYVTVWGV